MKSNTAIAAQFKKHKGITDRGLSAQRENSEKCDAFYEANYLDVNAFGRVPVQINKCQPYVNAINGLMIQNRGQAKYAAMIEGSEQEKYSRNANITHTYARKKCKADQVETQGNLSLLKRGISATETGLTYDEGYSTTDPNGEFVMDDVTNDVGWDPMARKPGLTDRRWDYYRRSFDLGDAIKKFKGQDEDFEDDRTDTDTGFEYDPHIAPYDRSKEDMGYDWNSESERTVWVYFYTWFENETFYRAENPIYAMPETTPQEIMLKRYAMLKMDEIEAENDEADSMFKFEASAETLTFNAEIKTRLEELFEDMIECFPFIRKVYYRAVLSGNKVFTKFVSPHQKGSTVKFKTGDWYNKSKIWVGIINAMMEPTRYYNKALTALMYTIDAASKNGVLVEEDAVEDKADFEARYNKSDAAVWLQPGGIAKVKPKKEPFTPTGYENIIQLSDQAVSDTMGFDLATIVSSEQNKNNALLHRQLVKQVKTTLAPFFDSIENYLEDHARLMLDLMKIYVENNVGGMIRILGKEGQQDFLRLSQDMFAPEYDIEIQEAPETDEARQEQAQLLFNVGDKLVMAQDPAAKVFYAGGLKLLPLDSEYKKEMIEALGSEDPRIAALMQENQALKGEMNQKQMALLDAQTLLTRSQVDKNMSGVQKDAAGIAKTAEEIDRLSIENKIAAKAPAENVSVSI